MAWCNLQQYCRLTLGPLLVVGLFFFYGGQADAQQAASSDQEARLQAQVAKLIDQLGDANYHQRENAKWELERIGLAAFEQLRQASQTHPNAHVARAARYLLDSQDVVWWLETDSLEVRELLTTYNDSTQEDRDTILQQLAEQGTPDALLALCRLTRFESNETRSKSAALYLMQAITTQLEQESTTARTAITSSLPISMELTLGDSNRVATQWVTGLMSDLRTLDATLGAAGRNAGASESTEKVKLSRENLERWQGLIAQEHAAVSLATDKKEHPLRAGEALDRLRSISLALRFYRWLGTWITAHSDRAQALDLVRPSVRLIGSEPQALRTAAEWALESDLPELVLELANTYAEQFARAPEFGYMLAEGHLRLGNEELAQQVANAASDSVLENAKNRLLNIMDMEQQKASQHARLAVDLTKRGMHQWAEQEYLKGIALDNEIRDNLAAFYWMGGEHQKAADILKPLAEVALENQDLDLPTAPNDFDTPAITIANFYFYSGLAAKDRGDKQAALDFLRKCVATQFTAPNPDAVIAMKQLGAEEPYLSYFRQYFEQMSRDFRIQVIQAEEHLARAASRMDKASAGSDLAEACNQLAWLLGKCEMNPEEAISLSLRSLELKPDDPAYMDTLARCYFTAGQLENAVRIQRRVVKLEPHERQLTAQLKEFEDALAKRK